MVIEIYPPLALNEKGKRSENEDSIHPPISGNGTTTSNKDTLFIVCDGLGGAEKGEEASKIVCSAFVSSLSGLDQIFEHDFKRALEMAEVHIDEYVESHPDADGMATTLALLAFDNEGAKIVHIGDSRVYHIRNGQIQFKTYDHSLVNEMVSSNIISQEEAINHPQKNIVSRAIIGRQRPTKMDLEVRTDLQSGDYFFLCTDGITESVSDEMLCSILSKPSENGFKISEIFELCQDTSKDNFSAYLVQVKAIQEKIEGGKAKSNNIDFYNYAEKHQRMFPRWVAYILILLSVVTILTIAVTMKSLK